LRITFLIIAFVSFPLRRIVVQGSPPFLVVHTNAAYTRLTGIDSHLIIGKPIKELISIDKSNLEDVPPPVDLGTTEADGHTQGETATRSLPKDVTLDQLVVTSGFGHINTVQVHTKLLHQMVGKNVTVTINNSGDAAPSAAGDGSLKRDNEESNASSAGSCGGAMTDRRPVTCLISIAPIVSPSNATNSSVLVVDREAEVAYQKVKRIRHHHGASAIPAAAASPPPPPGGEEKEQQDTKQRSKSLPGEVPANNHHRKALLPLQLVTHFVIQLQSQGFNANEGSMESLSSNSASVEARLLGLSKEQVQQQRNAVNAHALHPLAEGEMLEEESMSENTTTKEPVATIG